MDENSNFQEFDPLSHYVLESLIVRLESLILEKEKQQQNNIQRLEELERLMRLERLELTTYD